MCEEHNIDIKMEIDKKDKQTINQIDGWNIEVKFNENGFSLENLVEEYIKEKFSVYQGLTKNIRSVIIFLWKPSFGSIYCM